MRSLLFKAADTFMEKADHWSGIVAAVVIVATLLIILVPVLIK